MTTQATNAAPPRRVSLAQATWVWAKVGWLSFGGPAGQIAMMHRELVEQRRWISEPRFLHALNYCMLLPGPEATQLAIYIGWLMHRTTGGLIAGILFVLPGVIALLGLSVLYASVGQVPMVVAVFFGLKAAVLAVVVEAVLRIARHALKGRFFVGVAVAAFLAIHVFRLPFPLIVAGAAVLGIVARRWHPDWFPAPASSEELAGDGYLIDQLMLRGELTHTRPSRSRALRAAVIGLVLWATPVVAVVVLLGHDSVLAREGLFFSETAVVTFGGAYAVLAFIAQRVVTDYGWLSPAQMLDGLALAETTPGPLIMVVQFVAFMAAFQHQSGMSPWLAGVIGSLLTVWGDLCAVLSVDLSRRPLYRGATRQPRTALCPQRRYRSRGGCGAEPVGMVHRAHCLRLRANPERRTGPPRCATARHAEPGGPGTCRGCHGGHASLPRRHGMDARHLRRPRRHAWADRCLMAHPVIGRRPAYLAWLARQRCGCPSRPRQRQKAA